MIYKIEINPNEQKTFVPTRSTTKKEKIFHANHPPKKSSNLKTKHYIKEKPINNRKKRWNYH